MLTLEMVERALNDAQTWFGFSHARFLPHKTEVLGRLKKELEEQRAKDPYQLTEEQAGSVQPHWADDAKHVPTSAEQAGVRPSVSDGGVRKRQPNLVDATGVLVFGVVWEDEPIVPPEEQGEGGSYLVRFDKPGTYREVEIESVS